MNYLKFHRLKLGLTQHQVAKRSGLSQGAYCSYEKGYKKPRPESYPKLAQAIERPVEEFVAKLHGVDASEMVMAGTK